MSDISRSTTESIGYTSKGQGSVQESPEPTSNGSPPSSGAYDNQAFQADQVINQNNVELVTLGSQPALITGADLESANKKSLEEQSDSSDDDDIDYSLINVASLQKALKLDVVGRYKKTLLSLILGIGYLAYFISILVITTKVEQEWSYWCDADGLVIVLTCIVFLLLLYFQVLKPVFGKFFKGRRLPGFLQRLLNSRVAVGVLCLALLAGLVTFLVLDSQGQIIRLQSLIGIATLLLFGFLFSAAPRKVRWRHVAWGIGLQYTLGLLILRWPVGQNVFQCASGKVTTFLAFTDKGSDFVFGALATEMKIFAFKVLPVILFFSFCIQILYYLGVMQWIVFKLGWLLQVTVGTTACESVNAAANIFLGQTEAPLLIKPYLGLMTRSEIHAVMTGGFATIAGSVLAAYVSFGVDPTKLISASVMNAPAALAFSKLFYPEIKKSKTSTGNITATKGEETNWLHAAMVGVGNAIPLVANIAANLIAFYAFVEMISHVFNWTCMLAGADDGTCSLENMFGVVFMPLAWVMGVPWADCDKIGELIGTKIIVNEFMAYSKLADFMNAGAISKRAEDIATYALCGFSNISSIGIVLGGFSAMAPERKADFASVVVRAMISGSCATFLTACVAGTLLGPSEDFIYTTTTDSWNTTTESFIYAL